MSKHHQHTWNESNIVDDVQFQEKDAELFKNLLIQNEAVPREEELINESGQHSQGKNC